MINFKNRYQKILWVRAYKRSARAHGLINAKSREVLYFPPDTIEGSYSCRWIRASKTLFPMKEVIEQYDKSASTERIYSSHQRCGGRLQKIGSGPR